MIYGDIFGGIKRELSCVKTMEDYGAVFKNNKCLCIFHKDNHPSVSVKNNRFTCWACGAHGDVIDWTAKRFSISLYDTLKKLCADYDLPYIRGDLTAHDRRNIAQAERHRRALEKIGKIQYEKRRLKYMELLDEYRELGYFLDQRHDEPIGDGLDDKFPAKLARRQYLDYILAHDSEEVIEHIDEVFGTGIAREE